MPGSVSWFCTLLKLRHRVKTKKFNKDRDHRKALMYSLAKGIIESESVKTTSQKAKWVKPFIEKLVTKAKKGNTLEVRRYLLERLRNNSKIVDKIFDDIVSRYKDRSGGYLRIKKHGNRVGDNAEMSVMSWVEPVSSTTEEKESEKKVKGKTAKSSKVKKKVKVNK